MNASRIPEFFSHTQSLSSIFLVMVNATPGVPIKIVAGA
jgi:hypothetical protein